MSKSAFCVYVKSCIFVVLSTLAITASAGETTRISVSSRGKQSNGFSSYKSISANGRYVAFASDASNLIAGDTNNVTDVFVHDRQTKQTTRVNVASNGAQANSGYTNGGLIVPGSFFPQISSDGRFVVFGSSASNLVYGDNNNAQDVFVHDRQTKQTTRVSVSSDGVQGNSASYKCSISADGRFVAFGSGASNLVASDTNALVDIFVHDRQTKLTTRASVASNGSQTNSGITDVGGLFTPGSELPDISSDGRFVAFQSTADNLVHGDTNDCPDVFVHDRQTKLTSRISIATGGRQGSLPSFSPSITANGRFVAFESLSDNLVPSDINEQEDVFVHDRQTKQTSRVSIRTSGEEGNSTSFRFSISPDGRFVAFTSAASNLIDGDINGFPDVFVHDLQTKQTSLISNASNGQQGNHSSYDPVLSADGRFVAFTSEASNLVTADTNNSPDTFVHDRHLDSKHSTDLKTKTLQKYLSLDDKLGHKKKHAFKQKRRPSR